MKAYMKKILSLVLVFACCLTVAMPVNATSPANKKLKITYKGKTLSFSVPKEKKLTKTKVKKAWGKPAKKYSGCYSYKKGKSWIDVSYNTETTSYGKAGHVDRVECEVYNKSIKVNGVKVGMKKSTAYKLLVKSFGKSHVGRGDGDYYVFLGKNGSQLGYIGVSYNKKGKVTSIYATNAND